MNEEIKAAKDVIQAVLKSKKILRLYPDNNPVYIKNLEETYNKFREFFYYSDELQLKIKQNEISYSSEQVYVSSEKEENLALFFFKDGIREITFKKGLTKDEMEAFLMVITLDFDMKVIDDDIGLGVLEDFYDIRRGARRLLDYPRKVFAKPVVGHAAHNRSVELRDIGELIGVIRFGEDRLTKILADFCGVDINSQGELDITNMISAEACVHDPRDEGVVCGILVELDSLYER